MIKRPIKGWELIDCIIFLKQLTNTLSLEQMSKNNNNQDLQTLTEEANASVRFSRNQRRHKSREVHMEVAHTGKQESVEEDAAGLNQSVNTIESSEKPEGAIATDNSKESSGLNTAKSSKKRKLEEITNEENLAAPVMSDASPQEATEQH